MRDSGIINGGSEPSPQRNIVAHCLLPPSNVHSTARPAAASEDDSAAFKALPTLDIPEHVYKVLRSIRVVLNEVIIAKRIPLPNWYLSIADLTSEIVTNHGSDLDIEEVSEMVTSFGAQFFDTSFNNGSWSVKDKSPLTVPGMYSFQSQVQLSTKCAAPPTLCAAQAEGRPDGMTAVG